LTSVKGVEHVTRVQDLNSRLIRVPFLRLGLKTCGLGCGLAIGLDDFRISGPELEKEDLDLDLTLWELTTSLQVDTMSR